MKLSLRKTLKLVGSIFILLTIGYHFSYFYLSYSFNQFTSTFDTPAKHETYSAIDLDNHYYLEAQTPSYGTLTGQLSVASIDGSYKLIIWRKFPKETALTFQVFSNKYNKFLSYPLEIKNGSIDLEFSDLSIGKQEQIVDMEREAKNIFGTNVLENTL